MKHRIRSIEQQAEAGARIVDKYSEKEKTHSEIETKKETENRGSAVPLHKEGYPLKLDALLS
jgi:putative transposase